MEAPMWQACAEWLCALEVLPANHKVMMPDATFQDLAYTLRDGVLLCHIVSSLDVSSINNTAVNHRPQMAQFLCLKNIRLFLAACKSHFGVREADLFEPSMLYDFTDFERVLHTLSELSRSSKVKLVRPDVEPWSAPSSNNNKSNNNGGGEDGGIYKRLESLANDDTYEEFYYKHHGGSKYGYVWGTGLVSEAAEDDRGRSYARLQYYAADEEKEEDIYADLGLVRKSQAGGYRHQRTSTQSASARLSDWTFEPKDKRDHCLRELLETEANYVDVLNMLRKNFIRPITTIKESDKKVNSK
jgi:guanine nucleotide exchange factor VAV